MSEPTAEDLAYEYLCRVSGQKIADWARDERNGTWSQALELVTVERLDPEPSEQ